MGVGVNMPSRACGQVPEGGRGSGVLVAMLLTLCSSSVAGKEY